MGKERIYDIIVIGAGPGGIAAAKKTVEMGGKVALIEKGELGGVCLNVGCVPTKTLVHKAKSYKEAKKLFNFSCQSDKNSYMDSIKSDWRKIVSEVHRVVGLNKSGIATDLKKAGIDIIFGEGGVLSDKTVEVVENDGGEFILNYSKGVIIATGSIPKKLSDKVLVKGDVLYSDDIFDINKFRELPKRILIIGGGVIGCEFASIFSNMDVEVTIVELLPSLLSGIIDEDFAKNTIEREFKKKKINVLTRSMVKSIVQGKDDLTVELSGGEIFYTDKVLVAVGREKQVVKYQAENIVIIGDAADGYGLAYTAEKEGEKAAAGLMAGELYGTIFPIMRNLTPVVVFSDPEIAVVGVTKTEAQKKGIDYRVAKYLYRAMGRSHCDNEIAGEVRMLVNNLTDIVVGVQLCGAYATELIQIANILMATGCNCRDWLRILWPHPVYAEIFKEALKTLRSEEL